jgi:mRNA (2'-O-methyladenosine-N6-)-methyltransferase
VCCSALDIDFDFVEYRYPKQQRLLSLKKAAVEEFAYPPLFLSYTHLNKLHQAAKFDVIVIDPPFSSSFTWDTLSALPIPSLAADPSFVFLWVGSGAGDGLERGREILAQWGYRRCEDVVWVKTNKMGNRGPGVGFLVIIRLIGIELRILDSATSLRLHCLRVRSNIALWVSAGRLGDRPIIGLYTVTLVWCLTISLTRHVLTPSRYRCNNLGRRPVW